MLWVGPLCCMPGIRKSRSGRMDRVHMRGMLRFCLVVVFVTLAARYPRAMCPTAYILVTLFRRVWGVRGSSPFFCVLVVGLFFCCLLVCFSLGFSYCWILHWYCMATVLLELWLVFLVFKAHTVRWTNFRTRVLGLKKICFSLVIGVSEQG